MNLCNIMVVEYMINDFMWFCLHSPTLVEPVKDIADIFGLLHIVRPMA